MRLGERDVVEMLVQILESQPGRLDSIFAHLTGTVPEPGRTEVLRERAFDVDGAKRIPDLLLIHRPIAGPPTVAMIEAKTRSLEGNEQTLDYSRILLCDDFKGLVPGHPHVEYFFLTPSGSLPSVSSFHPLSYETLYDWLDECDPSWREQLTFEHLSELLRATTPTDPNAFRRAWSRAFPAPDWTAGPDGNSNAARQSKKPLKAWKATWAGQTIKGNESTRECYHVHLECDITRPLGNRTVFLHMETHPYYSRSNLSRMGLRDEVERRRAVARATIPSAGLSRLWKKPTGAQILCLATTGKVFAECASENEITNVLVELRKGLDDGCRAAIAAWRG